MLPATLAGHTNTRLHEDTMASVSHLIPVCLQNVVALHIRAMWQLDVPRDARPVVAAAVVSGNVFLSAGMTRPSRRRTSIFLLSLPALASLFGTRSRSRRSNSRAFLTGYLMLLSHSVSFGLSQSVVRSMLPTDR